MAGEAELNRRQTAWVRGATDTKLGQAILTSERLLFFDKKFMGGAAAGVVGVLVDRELERRRDPARGPLLELPLASITRISRNKKLLNKDRLLLSTADEEYLFADGWKEWAPLLRDALTSHHGRQIVEDSRDDWRVEPAYSQRRVFGSSRIRITRAGTPATTAFAGTSFVTTALVPMIALSPTVTPRRMHAP
jgi:hypothetical protein